MQKMKTIIMGVLLLSAMVVGSAYADSGIKSDFNSRYGTSSTALNTCSLCHTSAPDFNAYGQDLFDSGTNFAAIEGLDSDGDGYSNLTEINARTFPGNASSVPASGGDTTLPTVSTFTIPSTSSSLTVAISALSATDNVGVTGYLVNESSTKPSATAAGWSATKPASYTFATQGAKTLYAWAKDAAGNVSAVKSASVTITITTPPPPSGAGGLISPATSGLYWDDTNKRLGVQENAPMVALDVVGNHLSGTGMTRFTGSGAYGFMTADTFSNSGSDESGFLLKIADTLIGQFGVRQTDNSIYIKNRLYGTNDIVTITSSGNVGIGTTTPAEKLEVNGGVALYTTDARPVCDVNSRGTFWFTQDNTNGDSADVCARVAGAYAWRKLF